MAKKYNDEFFENLRNNFKRAEEYYRENREAQELDYEFTAGNQWDPVAKADRLATHRICVEVDYVNPFLKQIINNFLLNMPSIYVRSKNYNTDGNIANFYTSMIKEIEVNSNAEQEYGDVFTHCLKGGEGYLRVLTEYKNVNCFDQEIKIRAIKDPFSVYIDPKYHYDNTMDYCFIFSNISKKEFELLYPDSEFTNTKFYNDRYDKMWIDSNNIKICEYFYKETKKEKRYLLSSGEVVSQEQLDNKEQEIKNRRKNYKKNSKQMAIEESMEDNQSILDDTYNIQIVSEKMANINTIKWVKTNGYEVLEETEWMGEYIPIVPIFGEKIYSRGDYFYQGVVRKLIIPQRMINLLESNIIELINDAPISPFIIPKGAIDGFEEDWAMVSRVKKPYIEYNPIEGGGRPERFNMPNNVSELQSMKVSHIETMKLLTGIQDSGLGINSQSEQSALAILTNKKQNEVSNYDFTHSFSIGLKILGRILIDLIPRVYDSKKIVKDYISNKDNKYYTLQEQDTDIMEEESENIIKTVDIHNTVVEDFNIEVSIGPYGESQRQQAVKTITALTQTNPELFNIMGDIMLKNMDWAGADEAAERFKKILPPEVAGDSEIPPQAQNIINQLQEQMSAMEQQFMAEKNNYDVLTSNLTAKLNELAMKLGNKEYEIQSKKEIEMEKLKVQILLKELELRAKNLETGNNNQVIQDLEEEKQLTPNQTQVEGNGDTFVLPGINSPLSQEDTQEQEVDEEETVLDSLSQKLEQAKLPRNVQTNIGNSVLTNNADTLNRNVE